MIKGVAFKAVAAMMAVWAAWSLGNLADMLRVETARGQALEKAAAEIRTQLEAGVETLPELAIKMGYIYRGDIVFFDGG